MNKKEFRAAMARYGDTLATLAEAIGISTRALSCKINGILCFKQTEIIKIKERYNLTPDELCTIFFARLVS